MDDLPHSHHSQGNTWSEENGLAITQDVPHILQSYASAVKFFFVA